MTIEDFEILVGRGAKQNDELTFRVARPTDVWLHAHGCAGSHVIVRAAGDERTGDVPRHVLECAASLAVFHSKARTARGKVPVSVCRVADVRKERGAPPGQVTLRRAETIRCYGRDM